MSEGSRFDKVDDGIGPLVYEVKGGNLILGLEAAKMAGLSEYECKILDAAIDILRGAKHRVALSALSAGEELKVLAERCRPAVAHDARLRERDAHSDKYAHHYKPTLLAEAERAAKLLDEIDAILVGRPVAPHRSGGPIADGTPKPEHALTSLSEPVAEVVEIEDTTDSFARRPPKHRTIVPYKPISELPVGTKLYTTHSANTYTKEQVAHAAHLAVITAAAQSYSVTPEQLTAWVVDNLIASSDRCAGQK